MVAVKTLTPIDTRQQQQAIDETRRCIDSGNRILDRGYDYIPVVFDLRGKAAGMFRIRDGSPCIRYNPWLFAGNFAENFSTTIPHEVSHYLVYRESGGRARPHGPEWQALMRAFSADPRRTVDFDLNGVPVRRYRQYQYSCPCRQHVLSSRRHRRIQRQEARYYCRCCKQEISRVAGNIEFV